RVKETEPSGPVPTYANGPVPTGPGEVPATTAGAAMVPTWVVSTWGNVDHGVAVVTTTVDASAAATDSTGARRAAASGAARWASRLVTTAAASRGVPSWNVTPSRSRIVQTVWSALPSTDSASSGVGTSSTSRTRSRS